VSKIKAETQRRRLYAGQKESLVAIADFSLFQRAVKKHPAALESDVLFKGVVNHKSRIMQFYMPKIYFDLFYCLLSMETL